MSPGRRDFLILGAVGAAAVVAGGSAGYLALRPGDGAGADLLAARFPDLSGRPRQLGEWRARLLLCNFWATWCAPCREEMPLLDVAQQKFGPIGLQVVGIAADNAANVREYLSAVRVAFPILVGAADAIDLMRRMGNRAGGLPFTVAVDDAREVRQRKLGPFTAAELHSELSGLLR